MKKVHILGASGSGTSTLGKLLETKYQFKHLDTDDYYWLPTNPPFTESREREERIHLLRQDILQNEKCVISGSLCGWGDVFIPYFDLVIRVVTPTDLRIDRIKQRELKRFGKRILPGGDMYEEHQAFLEWASTYDIGGIDMRSKALHDKWLKQISCTQIEINGSHIENELHLLEKYFE
jgi:adenylate kinase family enzyme